MAHDETLAERIRELLDDEPDITEKTMFGGIAFLAGGHMAISASGQDGVLVRVDPATSRHVVASTNAEIAVMKGRPMHGWLRVQSIDLRTQHQLSNWIKLGTAYARTLPPKTNTGKHQ